MKKITLTDYLKNNRQVDAARAIGVTPGAIAQMLRANRHIELIFHDNGTTEAIEIRKVGSRNNQAA